MGQEIQIFSVGSLLFLVRSNIRSCLSGLLLTSEFLQFLLLVGCNP